jgi:hypothetical protein
MDRGEAGNVMIMDAPFWRYVHAAALPTLARSA